MSEVIEDALRDRYDIRTALDHARQPDTPEVDDDEAMVLAIDEVRADRA